jgi:hypothetical protein
LTALDEHIGIGILINLCRAAAHTDKLAIIFTHLYSLYFNPLFGLAPVTGDLGTLFEGTRPFVPPVAPDRGGIGAANPLFGAAPITGDFGSLELTAPFETFRGVMEGGKLPTRGLLGEVPPDLLFAIVNLSFRLRVVYYLVYSIAYFNSSASFSLWSFSAETVWVVEARLSASWW